MAATKVIVKSTSGNKLCTKKNLLMICAKYVIKVTKVTVSGVVFGVFCHNIDDTEKLFDDKVLASMSDCGFTPVLPSELKSSRSILLKNVDAHIFNNSEEDIMTEILKCNEWCKIAEIIKFANTVKIVFSTSQMAERSLNSGLSMFYLHVPGRNITRDKFVRLLTCYGCYAPDDHLIVNCPILAADKSYKICSKCSSIDHDFKSCNANIGDYKCLNCGGNHHAMSMACKYRKEALRKKRSTNNVRSAAEVVKSSIPNLPQSYAQPQIDSKIFYKSMSLIFIASLKNVDHPGSFAGELNTLYELNGIPSLNLDGFEPPSIGALQRLCDGRAEPVNLLKRMNSPTPIEASFADTPTIASRPHQREKGAVSRPNFLNYSPPCSSVKPKSSGNLAVSADPEGVTDESVLHDAWKDYRVYKVWGTKMESTEELLRSWETGGVVIATETGSVPDYNTVMSLISTNVVPKMSTLKRDVFKDLLNSPKRFLGERMNGFGSGK